jgi:hypothetical protein
MATTTSRKRQQLSRLYFVDETAWLESCARLIQARRYRDLDYEHLLEYLVDTAERERREVRSRLLQLVLHLMKWQFQPKHRTRSWKNSILDQRDELEDVLSSKSLRNHAHASLADVYAKAIKRAIRETNLDHSIFPEVCPYSLEFLLGEEFPS